MERAMGFIVPNLKGDTFPQSSLKAPPWSQKQA